MSTTPEQAIAQLANLTFALAQCVARIDPGAAEAFLGAAVYASRQQGTGDGIALEIFQKTFPGRPLPTVVSNDVMETMIKKPKG